jgi:hypothetical protein
MKNLQDIAKVEPRARWLDERGKAGLSALMTIIIVVSGVYLGMKFIPARAAAYQFDDTVREQVVFAGARRRKISAEEIMRNLMLRAEDLNLPVSWRNVRITRRSTRIRIQVAYKVPIEMAFDYTYD